MTWLGGLVLCSEAALSRGSDGEEQVPNRERIHNLHGTRKPIQPMTRQISLPLAKNYPEYPLFARPSLMSTLRFSLNIPGGQW